MQTNYFCHTIPKTKDILQDDALRSYIGDALDYVLGQKGLGMRKPNLVNRVLELATSYPLLHDYEKKAHELFELFLDNNDKTAKTKQKLRERAERIYGQIAPYLVGTSVFDLGCGDGRVSKVLAENGLEVMLADVYENNYTKELRQKGYSFILFEQGQNVPINENELQFDNLLLLTVLHHSNNPAQTLNDAKRLTKNAGRIIVIESVYGINNNAVETDTIDCEAKELVIKFKKLAQEQQRFANIFFDHLYNRIIHYSIEPKQKVDVPFNFNTAKRWKRLFESNGLKQIEIKHLGIDQPTVPEYHTLHILEN